jgi:hypothetical protein
MIQSHKDVNRNIRHRGNILEVVREYGPEGISYPGLEAVFRAAGRFGAISQLEENVRYLADKGYLRTEIVEEPTSRVKRWLIWLTPQGIDLLDGVISSDPGVNTIE